MEGSSDFLPVLLRLVSAFLLGAVAAFMMSAEHPWRYVFVGWLGCAAAGAGLFWAAITFEWRSGVLAELIAFMVPAALIGGALGAILGLLWYRDF